MKALELFRNLGLRNETIAMSDLLAEYLRKQAAKTQVAYRADLKHFAKFVGVDTANEAMLRLIGSPTGLAMSVVLAYQAHMIAPADADRPGLGYAPSTVNRRIAALRSVVRLARISGATTLILEIADLDAEEESRDTRGPGLPAIRQMIASCDQDGSPRGLRDGALLRFALFLGLRRNELRMLDLGDMESPADGEEHGRLMVTAKRKRKKVPVIMTVEAAESALHWIASRGRDPGPLFTSMHRGAGDLARLGETAINQIVIRRAIKAGFVDARLPNGRPITPHGIRHTALTEVVKAHGLVVGQAFGRHSTPAMTQRYNDEKELHLADAQIALVLRLKDPKNS